jgi:crotonobetainyl-CoA:carnitine CoA-transferase CaiB-like acyl-CoA transferase
VLDASRVLAGPFCGQILGDLGADVIKVERPGAGDETRAWGPPFIHELSAYYLCCNRNKRAITLDMAKPEGARILHQLLDQSDVLLENFRTDSAEKLGLTPERLLARHPRLIVASISGFGRTGPMRTVPGYDLAIQAMTGWMNMNGPIDGPPFKVPIAVADVFTGLYAAAAVLACLHAREKSGHGYAADLALLDCALATQVNVAQAYLTQNRMPAKQGNAHLQIVPYQLFQTADGYLIIAIGNDGQWQHFCSAAAAPDLGNDERFHTNTLRVQHRAELIPRLDALLRQRTTQEWVRLLDEAKVPHADVWNYAQIFAEPQVSARGMKITVHDPQGRPVDLIGSPFHINGATIPTPTIPPRHSEHTDAVLRSLLELDDAALTRLRQDGVI